MSTGPLCQRHYSAVWWDRRKKEEKNDEARSVLLRQSLFFRSSLRGCGGTVGGEGVYWAFQGRKAIQFLALLEAVQEQGREAFSFLADLGFSPDSFVVFICDTQRGHDRHAQRHGGFCALLDLTHPLIDIGRKHPDILLIVFTGHGEGLTKDLDLDPGVHPLILHVLQTSKPAKRFRIFSNRS